MRKVATVICSLIVVCAFVACGNSGSSQSASVGGGSGLAVGTPLTASFATNLPTDSEGKPYIDYPLTITEAGNYNINLTSSNTDNYDPYLSLRQGANEVTNDDDSGGDLQARITHQLQPGSYTVRVTRFGDGQVESATNFTLAVSR